MACRRLISPLLKRVSVLAVPVCEAGIVVFATFFCQFRSAGVCDIKLSPIETAERRIITACRAVSVRQSLAADPLYLCRFFAYWSRVLCQTSVITESNRASSRMCQPQSAVQNIVSIHAGFALNHV